SFSASSLVRKSSRILSGSFREANPKNIRERHGAANIKLHGAATTQCRRLDSLGGRASAGVVGENDHRPDEGEFLNSFEMSISQLPDVFVRIFPAGPSRVCHCRTLADGDTICQPGNGASNQLVSS